MPTFNRNYLKLIACISMLIDHIGRVFPVGEAARLVMRHAIGRIAFPLFGFLLAEGFFRTRDRRKYLLRIVLLALLSELPYDLLFYQRLIYWKNQNVLFLLALGLLMFAVLEFIRKKERMHVVPAILLQLSVIAAAALLSVFLRFDYDAAGIVMLAAMFFISRNAKGSLREPFHGYSVSYALLAGTILLNVVLLLKNGSATPGALLAAVPAFFYNGKKGKARVNYAFYFFYPGHLLLLLLIRLL